MRSIRFSFFVFPFAITTLYAQVVKKRAKGRVVEVGTRVVFGTQERVAAYLATSSVSQSDGKHELCRTG